MLTQMGWNRGLVTEQCVLLMLARAYAAGIICFRVSQNTGNLLNKHLSEHNFIIKNELAAGHPLMGIQKGKKKRANPKPTQIFTYGMSGPQALRSSPTVTALSATMDCSWHFMDTWQMRQEYKKHNKTATDEEG